MLDPEILARAYRIHKYFKDHDTEHAFTYIPWEQLNEDQKGWWIECAEDAAKSE